MIRSLLATVAIGALTVAASAADLPTRKAPPAPFVAAAPIFTWTGFYVGAQVGYGWLRDRTVEFNGGIVTSVGTINSNGILGGIHAGYNQQSGAIVYGIEGDVELTNVKGTAVVGGVGFSTTDTLNPQGSIRARLGYAIDNALIYATGGLAVATFKTSYTSTPAFSASSTRTGWTLGAGVEYALNKSWSVRAEYRYTDFGSTANIFNNTQTFPATGRHSLTEQVVRVGVSYHFDTTGPVVAKY